MFLFYGIVFFFHGCIIVYLSLDLEVFDLIMIIFFMIFSMPTVFPVLVPLVCVSV